MALEGLRGVAAIMVVIFHALLIFYTIALYGPAWDGGAVQRFGLEDNLYGTPLTIIASGGFAVAAFFVLSGFVLSIGFFETGNLDIIKKLAAKRYIRLMIPALASILLVWLVMSLGLTTNVQASELTNSTWLGSMWNFAPNLFDAVAQGTWGIFVTGENYYNPVLWTMFYEVTGSFLVFGLLALFGKVHRRWLLYVVLVIISFQTWYLGFVVGMALADMYANKKIPEILKKWWVGATIFLIGLVIGAYPAKSALGTMYENLSIPGFSDINNFSLFTTVGATLVIVAVLTWRPLEKILSSRRISMLGKYTFSLYLTHKIVLFTVTTTNFMYLTLIAGMDYNQAAFLSLIISVPLIIVVTYLFERYIDAPSIRLSGVFSRWLLHDARRPAIATQQKQPQQTASINKAEP